MSDIQILKIQEKLIKSKKLIHGLIVLDDVKIYKKSKILVDLATKARHYKLTVICSVQYLWIHFQKKILAFHNIYW